MEASVLRYTSVICIMLEQKTGHQFKAIDTGSIVERFGIPLGCDKMIEGLQTDHDVMFVPTDIVVSA